MSPSQNVSLPQHTVSPNYQQPSAMRPTTSTMPINTAVDVGMAGSGMMAQMWGTEPAHPDAIQQQMYAPPQAFVRDPNYSGQLPMNIINSENPGFNNYAIDEYGGFTLETMRKLKELGDSEESYCKKVRQLQPYLNLLR